MCRIHNEDNDMSTAIEAVQEAPATALEEDSVDAAEIVPSRPIFTAGTPVAIPMTSIVMGKPDPDKRTFSKDFATQLAKSIKSEGLLHAPIVKKLEGDTYEVIDGRHRVWACRKILKWTEIYCQVAPDDDDLTEAIEIATNLWVNPLNEPQTRVAIKRWHSLYLRTVPEGGRYEGKHKGFAKEVEKNLGVSQSQAYRIATTAEHISDEDRKILETTGVPQNKIDKIAQLAEPEAVKETVNMVAAGIDPDEAIRHGKKIKKEKKEKAAPKANGKPAKEAAPVKTADQTDDEWLEVHCGKILNRPHLQGRFQAGRHSLSPHHQHWPGQVPDRSQEAAGRSQEDGQQRHILRSSLSRRASGPPHALARLRRLHRHRPRTGRQVKAVPQVPWRGLQGQV